MIGITCMWRSKSATTSNTDTNANVFLIMRIDLFLIFFESPMTFIKLFRN